MVYRTGDNNFGTAKWIVDPTAGQGTHTTIASALTSASSGDTIFIRPGTYTENPTLKAGVNLTAFGCDSLTQQVIINGKCTLTGAGTVTISGISLQTNSDFFLAVTGSAASIVNLQNCYLNVLNNTGISYTSSSSSSAITIDGCIGAIATTGITYFVATGTGAINIYVSVLNNAGASTTASSTSACPITFYNSTMGVALSTSSTGVVNAFNCYFNAGNATVLTTAGTGTSQINNCDVAGGTASALSAGSGTTIQLFTSTLSSSNTNAITGAGTISYGGVTFSGSSSTINTTTKSPIAFSVPEGGTGLNSTTAYAVLCGGTTTTGALQSIAALGSSGNVLTSNGAGALPTFQAASSGKVFSTVNQVITGTGTYTPTANMVYCSIQCIGGGGQGGCPTDTSGIQNSVSGGGGAGEYAVGIFSAATIGGSKAVTIGAGGTGATSGSTGTAGGTTSVGATLISAVGGSGGTTSAAGATATGQTAQGGSGGTGGTGGDYRSPGFVGGYGVHLLSGVGSGGCGANSQIGSGGKGNAVSTTGTAGTGYGAGGGGVLNATSQTGNVGGNGAAGVVIVTEYIMT